MCKILFFIFFILLLFPAFTNDGSYSGSGNSGLLIPIKNTAIIMEKEVVLIDIYKEKDSIYKIKFDCTFNFKNETNETQEVTIGFPHNLNYHMSYGPPAEGGVFQSTPEDPVFYDFIFFIDGKAVEYDIFGTEKNDALKEVPAYNIVYTVDIEFEPGEMKTLRNTYIVDRHWDGKPDPWGGSHAYRSRDGFSYILRSGLTWKKPIGQADIIITFHGPVDYLDLKLQPGGYKQTKSPLQYHYRYKDFSPQQDISAAFAYLELDVNKTSTLVRQFLDKGDYLNAYYQLERWDRSTLNMEKDKNTKDIIRRLAYNTAEKLYRTDFDKVRELYLIALHHTISYDNKNYFDFEYLDKRFVKDTHFKDWIHEKNYDAPCYYIAYNLACIHSRNWEPDKAELWLDIANQMNPDIRKLSLTDSDLDNLRKRFNSLINFLKRGKSDIEREEIAKYLKKDLMDDHDNLKRTPLMLALFRPGFWDSRDFDDIIHDFITAGSDLAARDKDGKTALYYFVSNRTHTNYLARDGHIWAENIEKVFDLLIKSGADPNIKDNMGRTPLIYYCQNGIKKIYIWKKLLEYSDITQKDDKGYTAFDYMAKNKSYTSWDISNLIHSLVIQGGDADIKDRVGRTALHIACRSRYPDEHSIRLLAKLLDDVNRKDMLGKTALFYLIENTGVDYDRVSEKDLLACLVALRKEGGDLKLRDFRGLTILDLAADGEMKKYLDNIVVSEKWEESISSDGSESPAGNDLLFFAFRSQEFESDQGYYINEKGILEMIPVDCYVNTFDSVIISSNNSNRIISVDNNLRKNYKIYISEQKQARTLLIDGDSNDIAGISLSPDNKFLIVDAHKYIIFNLEDGTRKIISQNRWARLGYRPRYKSSIHWINNREVLIDTKYDSNSIYKKILNIITDKITYPGISQIEILKNEKVLGVSSDTKVVFNSGYFDLKKSLYFPFKEGAGILNLYNRDIFWNSKGDVFYFSYSGEIYKYSLDTNTEEKILTTSFWQLLLKENRSAHFELLGIREDSMLYFIVIIEEAHEAVYSMDLQNGKVVPLPGGDFKGYYLNTMPWLSEK